MTQGPTPPIEPSKRLPVVAGERKDHRRDKIRPDRHSSKTKSTPYDQAQSIPPNQATGAYCAQSLSGGEKRGLKGGQNLLDRAKKTYMKTEFSGPNDRRPSPGIIKKTEI
jgi:hypothetical protein